MELHNYFYLENMSKTNLEVVTKTKRFYHYVL